MSRALPLVVLSTLLFAGCSRSRPTPRDVEVPTAQPAASNAPVDGGGTSMPPLPVAEAPLPDDAKTIDALVTSVAKPTAQDDYEAAVLDGLNLLGERKQAQALAAFEKARALQDTDLVRREIEKLKDQLSQQNAIERTVQDIRTVLADGKAEEAAKLIDAALRQYGGSDVADELGKLKRQADALTADRARDANAQRDRWRAEIRAALQDDNLRTAALTLEQALQNDPDPDLRKTNAEVVARLVRYDEGRKKALDLRRDPAGLEDALAALHDAARAWDTPQVRQEIDEFSLALQKRRDRISVVDFEVRGEVGLAAAGRTVAEELLPAFRSRFDLVERGQINRVLDELRLESGELSVNPHGREEVGRLAKVRYLVLGSVTPLNGITVQARVVEVRTGLVAQTARLSAPSLDALLPRLPQLAQLLMMTDDQKLAFEQAFAARFADVQPVAATAELPPPPPPLPPTIEELPRPLVTYTPRPPALGGLMVADLYQPRPVFAASASVDAVVADDPYRRRLLAVSIDLGDNCFRRHRFAEAFKHFSLALSMGGPREDIQRRLVNCRPFLPPPPPPVVVVPQPVAFVPDSRPVAFARPRLVVFSFLLNCPPGLVPPATGDWCADHFTSYCGASYDIVERGEVCWYMGRLNITMKDVLANPNARRCLAQALNVRYFLFGAIEQTASFNVTAHMIDAETGNKTGAGSIHVQDQNEMKLRMNELAQQAVAGKADQTRLAQEGKDGEKSLNESRRLLQTGNAAGAAELARSALKASPNNVAMQSVLQQAEQKQLQIELERARQGDEARRRAEADAARKREDDLAREALAARQRAETEAKNRDAAVRKADEERKQRAAAQLRAEANTAIQKGDYAKAVLTLQSAAALQPSDDTFKALAQAKAKADEAARAQTTLESAKRDAELKRQRDAAAARVDAERQRRETVDALRRKSQEGKDQTDYNRLVEQARIALGKQQFDAARSALEAAQRLKNSEEVSKLMAQVQDAKTLADARRKGDAAHRETELRLAAEKTTRAKQEAENLQKQENFTALLKQAQQAISEKNYDAAVVRYEAASKLFRTDAALTGLRTARDLRDRDQTARDAEAHRVADEAKKKARVPQLLAEGDRNLGAQKFDLALKAYREAGQLAPGNLDVLQAIAKAEHARDDYAARNRIAAEAERQRAVGKLLDEGKAHLAAKRYDRATASFGSALKLNPNDPNVQAALKEVDRARTATTSAETPAMKQRREDYELALSAGKMALDKKNPQGAANAYREALRLVPGDREATARLQEAERQVAALRAALEAEAKRKAELTTKTPTKPISPQPMPPKPTPQPLPPKPMPMPQPQPMPPKPMPPKPLPPQPQPMPPKPMPQPPPPKPMPMPPNAQAEVTQLLTKGADLEKRGLLNEAAVTYRQALKLSPGDVRASAALRQTEFNQYMAAGKQAAAGKRFPEAVKAYESALKLIPDNAAAKAALQKARDGKP